jgi:mono/diheme cytochrome c family protein
MLARSSLLALTVWASIAAAATTPENLLDTWRAQARTDSKSFADFSAGRGRTLYSTKASDWSCSTCHTSNPRDAGRHAVTNKPIQPLSPLANAARFSDAAKVEKWFRRNCNDVLKRECTAAEKGDVLTYLMAR